MSAITRCELPQEALLRRYQREGAYADCYATDVTGQVSHAAFVEAFYTTWLFKVEAQLLAWLVAKPSTNAQARQLATGATDAFAAWTVEARAVDQLLLCDFQGRTRSWLMVAAHPDAATAGTRLYFGSAVVPSQRAGDSKPRLGPVFGLLLGFHKLYSRALLSAAKRRLARLG
ncbi:hypothetical protein [Rhodoferax saidenbachensis]|uniref:DUF2867 domain-containing protein n=1 Tax=Rhodoferax saidenbachensis TaxID=1484693 RepID=A0A1P8KCC4_9BURK|nr:hypothetical protein [Rhodoferax saidenbachensis]APW43663.1 hypothetical protein RS694_14725 [Rhodoferax saidenbachensis]